MKKAFELLMRPLLRWRRPAAALHAAAVREHPELGEFRAPLSHGLNVVVPDGTAACSFSEIFLLREYAATLPHLPAARRWADLGCHCGFFSLWLEWERRRGGGPGMSEALLVDADPLAAARAGRLMRENGLGERFRVVHGAISSAPGEAVFEQRPFMASSLKRFDARPANELRVPVLDAAQLAAALPPPYDLVKVDIEGAEVEFLDAYRGLTSQTRALLIEWHSWNSAGADGGALAARLAGEGFGRRVTIQPPAPAPEQGPEARCGVELFLRDNHA